MKKTKLFTLATLSLLLASCGGNSTSTSTTGSASTAPTSTVTPSGDKDSTDTKPTSTTTSAPDTLTDSILTSVAADDATFGVESTVDFSAGGSTYENYSKNTTIKISEDVYSENGSVNYKYLNSSYSYSTGSSDINAGYWKGSDKKIHYNTDPDLYNNVEEKTLSTNFDGTLTNPFEDLSSDLYSAANYDLKKTYGRKGYSVFKLADDFLEDEDVISDILSVDTFVNDLGTMNLSYFYSYVCSEYLGSSATLSAKNVTVDYFNVNANSEEVTGFSYKISTTISASTTSGSTVSIILSSEADVKLSNLYTTELTKDSVVKAPFTKTAGAETQYAAFESAITKMQAGNYEFEAYIKQQKTKLYGYKGAILTDEYSVLEYEYNTLGTAADDSTYSYSGIHKVSDGVYDYYSSDTAAIAKGSSHATASIPTYAFSSEIFEYDATNSSADEYVFNLRDAYTASDIVSLSTIYTISGAQDLSFTVNKDGTLKEINLSYTSPSSVSSSAKATYYVTFSFSNVGTTTTIPSDLATFTNYVAYTTPSSYSAITDYIFDYVNYVNNGTSTLLTSSLDTYIKAVVGDENYSKVPDFLNLVSGLGDSYYQTLVATTSYTSGSSTYDPFVRILFAYSSSSDLTSALSSVLSAAKTAGYSYTASSSSTYVTLSGVDGATVKIGYTTSSSYYLLYIEISATSTTTSTTSL